ncbi:hypothetical protein AB6A40_009730 [Gnathostoma spinigerum]|uniref:Uncharacterized protein n=1 Tax=Gnathostoma spinigerum TaxID=75299 RepID=A0ABD6EZP0_9BILA
MLASSSLLMVSVLTIIIKIFPFFPDYLLLFSTLIGIVDLSASAGRIDLIRSFVYFEFCSDLSGLPETPTDETIHGAILKYIPCLLSSPMCSSNVLATALRQLWFLLDVASKSISQHILDHALNRVSRKDRFSSELLLCMESTVEKIIELIKTKHREFPVECRSANIAIAYFLRCSLSFVDRGSVYEWIYFVVSKLDEDDWKEFREFKLELLRILVGHEHWLPLCLPVLFDAHGEPLRGGIFANQTTTGNGFLSNFFSRIFSPYMSTDEERTPEKYSNFLDDLILSQTYCQRHFLVGLLFQEVNAAFREPRDYRRRAIALLRNLIAKHTFDKRYNDTDSQSRIAILYAPIIRLLLDNISEIEAAATLLDFPDKNLPKKSVSSTETKRKSIPLDWRIASFDCSSRSESLAVESSASCAPAFHTSLAFVPTVPAHSTGAAIAGIIEQFGKSEVRDLLICLLYVIRHVPQKVLSMLWLQQNADSSFTVISFIHLLELTLKFFRYRGKKYTIEKSSNKIRGTRRTLVILPPSSSMNTHSLNNACHGCQFAETDNDDIIPFSVLQESNLSQEVALVILETVQSFSQQLALRSQSLNEEDEKVFMMLLKLELSLLSESWSEPVRHHAIASTALFINLFRNRFFKDGSLEALSLVVESLMIQLNSCLESIQNASAALLQVVLRNGYDYQCQLLGMGSHFSLLGDS